MVKLPENRSPFLNNTESPDAKLLSPDCTLDSDFQGVAMAPLDVVPE